MKLFSCPHCGNRLYFENGYCLFCGSHVLYDPARAQFALAERDGRFACANAEACGCNWAVEEEGAFCQACRLNRTIPNLTVPGNRERWAEVEAAKRHLVFQLLCFGLAVEPKQGPDSEEGIAFDVLQDPPDANAPRVMTGHDQGLITLNLAEADPVQREKTRLQMGEPYRTLLGHFRHEIGHYYWDRLVRDDPAWLGRFRDLFGDERADYAEALKRNYDQGPPPDWAERHISAYASSHPWEDFAETWAHFLHIADLMEMAEALALDPDRLDTVAARLRARAEPSGQQERQGSFDALLRRWASLREAANALNRCMGLPDLYPFVISPATAGKLRFVYELLASASQGAETLSLPDWPDSLPAS